MKGVDHESWEGEEFQENEYENIYEEDDCAGFHCWHYVNYTFAQEECCKCGELKE